MTLPTLIERVRAATGPDRELDARIDAALTWKQEFGRYPCDLDGHYRLAYGGYRWLPAEFTASLDAAIALCERVLPEADWQVCKSGGATVVYGYEYDEPLVTGADAATPALALVLAILTALQAQESHP